MTEQHPISPPQELVKQWWEEAIYQGTSTFTEHIAARSAQWGWDQREPEIQAAADAELEACVRHLDFMGLHSILLDALRAARRPEPPPSLKQQGLDALSLLCEGPNPTAFVKCKDTILRALEALPDD